MAAAVAEVEREKEMESSKKKERAPWEQHSTVISIPRFDYDVPFSLLQHPTPASSSPSPSGEKRHKEAKYVQCFNSCSSEENTSSKRRKLSKEETDDECCNGGGESKDAATANSGDAHDDLQEGTPRLPPAKADAEGDAGPLLSPVKLTKSGLLLLTFRRNTSSDVVDTVSKIIQSLESRSVGSPLWCNRIVPIQATCSLKEKELHEVVSKLVLQFVNDHQKLVRPIKVEVKSVTNALPQWLLLSQVLYQIQWWTSNLRK